MKFDEIEILIPSNRPDYVREVQKKLLPYSARHFDGTGYPSICKLRNDCIVSCRAETVILVEDKQRPTAQHIERMVHILNHGFGMVGMFRFGFMGFRKELFRRMGFWDERFVGGGWDGHDWLSRMREANIAVYLSEEVERVERPCAWNEEIAKPWFIEKWGGHPDSLSKRRQFPEENYGYDIGPGFPDMEFLPWKRTVCVQSAMHLILLA